MSRARDNANLSPTIADARMPNLTGDVTTVEGAVATTITDNAVTLAKMAGGIDGRLITYDTSGDPAYVATGTSGHVLTSAGADAVPTFQVSNTMWKKIAEVAFSGTSSLELGQALGTTQYKRFKFYLTVGNDGGTNGTTLYYMQVKIGGSWIAGTSYAGSIWWSFEGGTTLNVNTIDDTSSIRFNSSEGSPFLDGSGVNYIAAFSSWEFTFSNFTQSGTDNWSHLWWSGIASNHDNGNPAMTTTGACTIMNTGAVTDIKIWPLNAAANATIKGNYELYGIS